ncbi:hypothetical protein D3C83_325750 [compost metagenome]
MRALEQRVVSVRKRKTKRRVVRRQIEPLVLQRKLHPLGDFFRANGLDNGLGRFVAFDK